jgi:hypothetical protein
MGNVRAAVVLLALLFVFGSAESASSRPADPETTSRDLLLGAAVQLDPGVPHRLSPGSAALSFLRVQPEAHIDSLRLVRDETTACQAEPRLGCPAGRGRGPVWLIEASGRLRYCPRVGSASCPLYARHGYATILDHDQAIVGFGISG